MPSCNGCRPQPPRSTPPLQSRLGHGPCLQLLDTTTVYFRALSALEIERYVTAEQPLDCAGAFRSEGLGIALFARVVGEDPTGLIGMPLIALSRALRQLGYELP